VHLYSGIDQVALLGETEAQVMQRSIQKPKRANAVADLASFGFNPVFTFEELGVNVFFKNGVVALIEVQEPFRGKIVGKNLHLFPFEAPQNTGWDDILIKEFGSPTKNLFGGRFNSQSFVYAWGDVSFNRMGPNQVAFYRDNAILNYREKNFGRVVKLFEGP